jgi:acyl-CoA synthetase (AMP-forming)/AMP-acid ligase II
MPLCCGWKFTHISYASVIINQSPIIAINAPYPGKRSPGSVGKSVGGVTTVIVDPDTQRPVGPGKEGEICCYG